MVSRARRVGCKEDTRNKSGDGGWILFFFFFFLKTPEQKKEDGLNLKPWSSHCQIRTFNILLVLGPDGESQRDDD